MRRAGTGLIRDKKETAPKRRRHPSASGRPKDSTLKRNDHRAAGETAGRNTGIIRKAENTEPRHRPLQEGRKRSA